MKEVYSIYDKKNGRHVQFIVHDNEINLKRDLGVIVNSGDQNNFLVTYPEDFSLNHLGSIDEELGVLIPGKNIVMLDLIQLKRKEK